MFYKLLLLISDNNNKQTDTQNVIHKSSSKSTSSSPSSSMSSINQNKKEYTDTVLVVNPKSASGSTGKGWEDFYIKIKEVFGQNPEVAFTKKAGDGTIIATRFLKKGFKKIVAIGGDGTINEVANGFFFFKEEEEAEENADIQNSIRGSDKNNKNINNNNRVPKPPRLEPINSEAIMALVPSGTRNVLAKSLDLPEGVVECCQNFVKGKPKKIDVISATVTDQSNHSKVSTRIFLNAAEIGIGGEIIDKSKKMREKVKSRIVSTVSTLISTVPNYKSNLCEILIDNDERSEAIVTKMTMCIIANGKYLGGGFRAAPDASVSDGLLDVVVLKESSNLEMIENFLNVRDGNYTNEGDIFYKQAKKVSIKSKEEDDKDITVTIDGEPIGVLPATFQVLQNALTVRI